MTSIKKARCRAYAYVRFSTPDQVKGDSRVRQSRLIRQFVQENDLELDDSLHMDDLGVSAFRGDNRLAGLGKFLDAVKQGRVTSGSYLLLESLDRLTRQNAMQAATLFMSMLQAGIHVVTLADVPPRVYSPQSGFNDLLFAVVTMSRAYEESAMKSKRLQSAWRNKRHIAANKKMTSRGPEWLEYNAKLEVFELIPVKAKLVRRIFDLARDGAGKMTICRLLNEEKTPTFSGKGALWQASYIHKILGNRAVIGELQPHRDTYDEDGRHKRVPDGEAIEGYYPSAVPKALFYEVQRKRAKANKQGGRRGSFANLFSKIAKCGYCGTSMVRVNKGTPPKGATYYICSKAQRGGGCRYALWRYDKFEKAFLTFCSKVDLGSVLTGESPDAKRQALQERQVAARGKLDEARHKQDRLIDALQETIESARKPITTRINELARAIDALEADENDIASQLALIVDPKVVAAEVGSILKKYHEREANLPANERALFRMRVNAELRRAIRVIRFYKSGLPFDGPAPHSPFHSMPVALVIFNSGACSLLSNDEELASFNKNELLKFDFRPFGVDSIDGQLDVPPSLMLDKDSHLHGIFSVNPLLLSELRNLTVTDSEPLSPALPADTRQRAGAETKKASSRRQKKVRSSKKPRRKK